MPVAYLQPLLVHILAEGASFLVLSDILISRQGDVVARAVLLLPKTVLSVLAVFLFRMLQLDNIVG